MTWTDQPPAREVRQARGSRGQEPTPGLARDLGELARQLQHESDPEVVLQRLVAAALQEITPATAVGITTVKGTKFRTVAAIHDVLPQIDQVQYEHRDGPCVRALRESTTVRCDDLAAEDRWPHYAAAAVEHGFRSLVSFELFVEGDSFGALNVYAPQPNAFTDRDEEAGLLLASHAAVAIVGNRVEANLRTALESRDIIGQAKGILMERFKVNAEHAFQILVAISQHQHRKLHDVADDLTATGDLPSVP